MENLIQIQEKIKKFIIEISYLENGEINDNTLIFEQGILDSMGFMSLITFLDESFSVNPSGDELIETNFESINAIADYIYKKLDSK